MTTRTTEPAERQNGIELTRQHADVASSAADQEMNVLDRAHLARYTLGDATLEREVLGLFIDQAPKTLAQLRACQTADEWHLAAHTLKGSARAVGAWRLAKAAEVAEIERDNLAAWATCISAVAMAIDEVALQISADKSRLPYAS